MSSSSISVQGASGHDVSWWADRFLAAALDRQPAARPQAGPWSRS